MVSFLKQDVRIFPDINALNQAVAQSLVAGIRTVVNQGARFHLALSGGNTPRSLYCLLAQQYREQVHWDRVHLFWGDERYVPRDDPHSNYLMLQETLLKNVAVPEKNVHPMPTDFTAPEDAAVAYERMLQNYFSTRWPRFHLILLGLGTDGHTASLFPGSPALEERERWVVVSHGPTEPRLRLSLTLPVLNHAEQIYFLVAGREKAETLRRILSGGPDARNYPAADVHPNSDSVIWWVDEAAASRLDSSWSSQQAGA